MKIRVSRKAAGYIRSEAKYLRSYSPQAAQNFLTAIQQAKKNLRLYPDMGTERGQLPIPGSRTLITGEYLISYIKGDDYIDVILIKHSLQTMMLPVAGEDDYQD